MPMTLPYHEGIIARGGGGGGHNNPVTLAARIVVSPTYTT